MSVSLKDEVQGAALGDQRLTKRLGKVIVPWCITRDLGP